MVFRKPAGKTDNSLKGWLLLLSFVGIFVFSGTIIPAIAEEKEEEITFDPEDVEGMVLEPITGADEKLMDMEEKVSGIKRLVEASRPSIIRITSTPVPKDKIKKKRKSATDVKLVEINSTADSLGIGTIDNSKKDRAVTSKLGMNTNEVPVDNLNAPDKILASINSRLGGISACYAGELKVNPALSGRLYVQFTILESGSVSQVKAVQSSLNSTRLEQCILNGIQAWRFKAPDQGQVTVRHPFIFERAF